MSYVRNLILFATFIFIGISASNASADADDFNLDYDDPANGESNVDPENIIEMYHDNLGRLHELYKGEQ